MGSAAKFNRGSRADGWNAVSVYIFYYQSVCVNQKATWLLVWGGDLDLSPSSRSVPDGAASASSVPSCPSKELTNMHYESVHMLTRLLVPLTTCFSQTHRDDYMLLTNKM